MKPIFNHTSPIYLQLAEYFQKQILRGDLLLGEKLPSVRDTAVTAGVNPNTVQKTYKTLQHMGIVIFKRGQGTFVTNDAEVLQKIRTQIKNNLISSFIQDIYALGLSSDEVIQSMKDHLNQQGDDYNGH